MAEENNASFRSALYALSIALGAMYLLLLTQYQSFLKPLLIYVAILLAIPGVLVGLYLTSNPFGFFVVIGFLGLCGIVVNNSIMIVDQIQQGQAAGLSVRGRDCPGDGSTTPGDYRDFLNDRYRTFAAGAERAFLGAACGDDYLGSRQQYDSTGGVVPVPVLFLGRGFRREERFLEIVSKRGGCLIQKDSPKGLGV